MDFKVYKDTLVDGLIKRTSSMLDEIESKMCIATKKVMNRGKQDTEWSKDSRKHM